MKLKFHGVRWETRPSPMVEAGFVKGDIRGKHWAPTKTTPRGSDEEPRFTRSTRDAILAATTAQIFSEHTSVTLVRAAEESITGSKRAVEDAGIRAGEIVAYRCWRLISNRLISLVAPTIWNPGVTIEGGDVLTQEKQTGVHAFRERDWCYVEAMNCAILKSPIVIGTVALWGEVMEHDFGYRAQYGKIVSIDDIAWCADYRPFPHKELVAKLETLQGYYNDEGWAD